MPKGVIFAAPDRCGYFFGGQKMKGRNTTRALSEGALMIALAQALGYLKLFELPQGGSVTLAMLPVVFFAVRFGLRPGLLAGFTFGLLQLALDGAYAWGWQSIVGDYLLAFIPLGLGGLFQGRKLGLFWGILAGATGRFLVHFVVGATVWAEYMPDTYTSPWVYSLVYNGSYMAASTILCLLVALLLFRPLKKYILAQDLR